MVFQLVLHGWACGSPRTEEPLEAEDLDEVTDKGTKNQLNFFCPGEIYSG